MPPDTLPFAVCAPSEAHPVLDSGHFLSAWTCTTRYAASAPPLCRHSDRPSGVPRLHGWRKFVSASQCAEFPVSAAVLLSIAVRTFDVLLWPLTVAQPVLTWNPASVLTVRCAFLRQPPKRFALVQSAPTHFGHCFVLPMLSSPQKKGRFSLVSPTALHLCSCFLPPALVFSPQEQHF